VTAVVVDGAAVTNQQCTRLLVHYSDKYININMPFPNYFITKVVTKIELIQLAMLRHKHFFYIYKLLLCCIIYRHQFSYCHA